MDRLSFYKDLYFHENERYHKLTIELSLPISMLTICGTILISYVNKIVQTIYLIHWNFYNLFLTMFFSCLLILSLSCWIFSLYFLYRARFLPPYSYLPTIKEMENYKNELMEWNKKLPPSFAKNNEELNSEYEEFIIESLSSCIEINTHNNDSKSGFLHNAIFFSVLTLIFILLATIFHIIIELFSLPHN